jgi:hypothetical protein
MTASLQRRRAAVTQIPVDTSLTLARPTEFIARGSVSIAETFVVASPSRLFRSAVAAILLSGSLLASHRTAFAEDKPLTSGRITLTADVEPVKPAVPLNLATESSTLPLQRLVLFTSGVGYFEHQGQVEGTRSIQFQFDTKDINDLLKSLVVQDLDGGSISNVTYASRDPLARTLKAFSIDLTEQPTLAQLLIQVRGEQIEVAAPNPITGAILGVEKRRVKISKEEYGEVEFINLVTDLGLKSIPFDSITSIKLLNPALDAELREVLKLLASSHKQDKTGVEFHLAGEGSRRVRMGYIQETPVWKTSYRLVLDKNQKPVFQGWAHVENTTDNDWKNVRLELVSGRPISFQMDLYQPLYVDRPMLPLETYATARSSIYEQGLNENTVLRRAENQVMLERAKQQVRGGALSDSRMAPMAASAPMAPSGRLLEAADRGSVEAEFARKSLGLQTSAGNVGELFRYAIDTPVSLGRQQSAMIPIVNDTLEVKKLSIYAGGQQGKHPKRGLKLVNSTDLNLMQGPITIFDEGAYAGDARISDLSPKAERLIDYALDLDVEVVEQPGPTPSNGTVTSATLLGGLLRVTRKMVRSTEYALKNSDETERVVLIERPLAPEWKLVEPAKPTETTRDARRFEITLKPGESKKFVVTEEQAQLEAVDVRGFDLNRAIVYISATQIRPELQEVIKEIRTKLQAIAAKESQVATFENDIRVIGEEQTRIRQNMEQLDRTTELYNRYVKKFGGQEDQMEKLRGSLAAAKEELLQLRDQLNQYISQARFE